MIKLHYKKNQKANNSLMHYNTPKTNSKNTQNSSSFFIKSKKWLIKVFKKIEHFESHNPIKFIGLCCLSIIALVGLFTLLKPLFINYSYKLNTAESLLSPVNTTMADKIKYDEKTKSYSFNNSLASSSESASTGTQKVTAMVYKDAAKGVTVTDTTNKINFSITPKFNLQSGKQDNNRIVYPLTDESGWLVYTMRGTGVKEDILLDKKRENQKTYSYKLTIGDELEARIESDGSIGVYGNSVLSGNVSTSTENDASLLQKARKNAKKDTLMFSIPKPVIIENSVEQSNVKASYSINGDELKLSVSNLENATYPLSIDPSIYVVTAQQFMAGNNETNINFNVNDKLIEKGHTTGARFDAWNNTMNLPTASWGGGTVAAGGYIYSVGGTSFSGQIYSTQGASTFVVPDGVTSINARMWGGGGGGGAGGSTAAGGAGGGSGYIYGSIPVTPGETLNIYVGGGGGAGTRNTAGGGGGGGGSSTIYRGSTLLAIVAGGGGGGGGRATASHTGGAGGAGGGTSGISGSNAGGTGTATGGGGGTLSSGGAAGTGGRNVGTAGSSLTGGLGANGRNNSGADGGASNGGLANGGAGGSVTTTTYAAGGGGGAGYFGGGGGSASTGTTITTGGSGGGGGSSYTNASVASVTNTAGSGITPGNSSDTYRSGAGNGGTGGAIAGVGTAGADGLIAITYGAGGTTVNQSVNWAKFNTSTGVIDSANPGSGVCSGWCTTADYNLPSPRTNFSLVAYNGFLYAIGGIDSSGTKQNTVYIAKLGANGEPQLWHPTDTNKNNWSYWYQDTGISSVRSDTSVVAYNNRIYLIGGKSASGPVNTVEVADINPTGTLVNWTSSTNLPINLYGHSAQVYNDRLYVVGGASTIGGAPLNSIYYVKINSNGTLNNWNQATNNFSNGRISVGGNLSAVWGGYLYVSGGCSAVNASGYCTTVQSDTQVASINADGSIDVWNNIGGVSSQRMGSAIVTWRDKIYAIGGCSAQNTTTGDCNSNMLEDIIYGQINQDGDASTVDQSVASGIAPCNGTSPSGCDQPGTTYVGNMLSVAFITNGYLYIIGGCTNNTCSTTNGTVSYVAISSTGSMTKPATCPYGTYQGGAWCVDTTHTISGGIAAASPVIFNNRIYLIGGLNGSANKNTINRADLNSDGSIGSWAATQSMTGLGMTNVSYTYAFARANPASAGTYPGNMYVLGGCSTSSAAGCTAYATGVYKCNILTDGTLTGCSTSGQLQIGVVPGDGTTYTGGLGIMSGTVYANYVYLVGGVTPVQVDLATIMYAKIDNNGNIVPVTSYPSDSHLTTAIGTGSTSGTGAGWVQSAQQMAVGRRRSSAFGYNGYIYAVGGYEASTGVLADIEFIKVNVSDGSIGSSADGWHVSAVQINQRWGLSVAVSNSYAYVIGGCTVGASPSGCTTRTDIIQTFQIYNNDSGAPAGFTNSANTYTTDANRIGASSVILNGYIYAAGGCISATDCTTASSNVSYAPIDANGSIGSWSIAASLPAVRTWGKLEAAGGSLYYIGGQTSTATDRRTEIYYTTPVSGNITAWSTASNNLPSARTKFGASVWNNRLYVIGGEGAGTGCTANNVCNTVYVSPQLNSGGDITSAWTTTSTAFNVARSGLTAITYANNLYIFGGFDGINYLSDSQYSQINSSNGQIGSWTYSTSLPGPLSQANGFAANGYIYLMGGRSSATTCDPTTMVAPISANTTISSGNNPTGIGAWYETNQRFTGNRYGASAVYNDGKAYVLGGGCGSTLTYASPVTQQTTLLSQPQVAKYSIMIDTDSDVFPNQWLLNGVDNSIGAKWRLKYRSMTNTVTSCTSPTMTTWGQETVFGDVTLGLPGVYTPKNSSGTNTNCARFYYFNVTVDSSEAYGYPDDVTRGPTITDLTLQFTADPSKRLMHGRTFTGGLQQPIDTPNYSY